MAGNSSGILFRLTTFGESHGPAIGGVVDGCPSGIYFDEAFVRKELSRRQTAKTTYTSSRAEPDQVKFLSGIFDGKTTGAPIAFLIENKNQDSSAYEAIKDLYRPGHADYTNHIKYKHFDYRGGGRSSGRESISRVVGGAIAKMILIPQGIDIMAFTSQIGPVKLPGIPKNMSIKSITASAVNCPDAEVSEKMLAYLHKMEKEGDTAGGVISCIVKNMPAGLGDPVFDKLEADLAKAMLSIGSVTGFEYGTGFSAAEMKGSENNDAFTVKNSKISTQTNNAGGIQGGISNGNDLFMRIAFKPVSSIRKKQKTVDHQLNKTSIEISGRHDVCIVPRANVIVEAMAALVIADHLLRNRSVHF